MLSLKRLPEKEGLLWTILEYYKACHCWPKGQFGVVLCNQSSFHWLWGNIYLLVSSVFLCFSLVTINWQTSYDRGILCQDYRIIQGFTGNHLSANLVWLWQPSPRVQNQDICQDYGTIWGLPMGHHVTIWIVHLLKWIETGLLPHWTRITASDKMVQALQSCSSCFFCCCFFHFSSLNNVVIPQWKSNASWVNYKYLLLWGN